MKTNRIAFLWFAWIGLPVYLQAAELSVDPVSIQIMAVSPRMIQQDTTGLLHTRSTGLFVVGVGETCYLSGIVDSSAANPVAYQWSFTVQPTGSNATLRQEDQAQTNFVPESEGWYEVQLSVSTGNPASTITQTQRILAASYVGVGGQNNDTAKFPECSLCHASVAHLWKETRHANVLKAHLNGERSNQYDPSCFQCHTLGFDSNLTAADNGFHSALKNAGITPEDIASMVNDAYRRNHDNDPKNDVAYYETLNPALRAKANVQCENCHGPGSQHLGDKTKIGLAWDARVCAQCHDSQGYNGYPYPFDSSSHKKLPQMFQDYPVLQTSACAKCHTAKGFEQITIEKDATSPIDDEEPHAVSCVACHDPHNASLPHQLRTVSDVLLESGYIFSGGGMGNLCVNCHQSRVSGDLATYINNNTVGSHYGPQAEVLLGVNAWTFGESDENQESVHKLAVQDTCVACHMAKIPANGWNTEKGIMLGGHSFKITNNVNTPSTEDDLSNYHNACVACHLTMKSVDRVLQGNKDFDGNGKTEGIQTEVHGLMNRIAEALQTRYPSIQIADNGDLDVPGTLFGSMSFTEKAAIYNYRFFLRDGSFGIHNARFTVQTLQTTYTALTLHGFRDEFFSAN